MKKHKGFTLIEIIITLAILSILLTIAIPKYKDYVRKGNRVAAQGELMQIATNLERYKALQLTYSNATLAAGTNSIYGSTTYPIGATGTKIQYNLTMPTITATTWVLVATPANVQDGDGVIKLNSLGQNCWKMAASDCDLADATQAWGN